MIPPALFVTPILLVSVLLSGEDSGVVTIRPGSPGPPNASSLGKAPSDGNGAITGVLELDCGSSPLSGCQGGRIPDVAISIRQIDGDAEIRLSTAVDGSYWAEVPPGYYVVDYGRTERSVRVEIRAGEVTTADLLFVR